MISIAATEYKPLHTTGDLKLQVPEQQKTPTASPIMDKGHIENKRPSVQTASASTAPTPAATSNTRNLQDVLGSQFASWPYGENSLIHAINLRTEQERTKQEYYKAENLNKSLELLKHTIAAGIPPTMIPIIFAGQSMSSETVEMLAKKYSPGTHEPQHPAAQSHAPHAARQQPQMPAQPQEMTVMQAIPALPQRSPSLDTRRQHHIHERSQTISTPNDVHRRAADEFVTPPMPRNFRFGGDTSETSTPQSAAQQPPMATITSATTPPRNKTISRPTRQLSPAKLGAAAVASLNNRFSPIHREHHMRTTSLPPKVSIPESSAMSFHQEERAPPKVPTVNTPGQPVILQHQLIQFHHWTPSQSEAGPTTTPNKRRRSDDALEEKAVNELKDDNVNERRKFITTHTRSRSDTSMLQPESMSADNLKEQSEASHKSVPPKYPNILSND